MKEHHWINMSHSGTFDLVAAVIEAQEVHSLRARDENYDNGWVYYTPFVRRWLRTCFLIRRVGGMSLRNFRHWASRKAIEAEHDYRTPPVCEFEPSRTLRYWQRNGRLPILRELWIGDLICGCVTILGVRIAVRISILWKGDLALLVRSTNQVVTDGIIDQRICRNGRLD